MVRCTIQFYLFIIAKVLKNKLDILYFYKYLKLKTWFNALNENFLKLLKFVSSIVNYIVVYFNIDNYDEK